MCWACYTPLTAGAGAAMSAGLPGGATTFPRSGTLPGAATGAGAASSTEGDKKKVDPRLFFIGGGLLFAGLVAAYTNGMLGGGQTPTQDPSSSGINAAVNTSSGFPGTLSSAPIPPAPPPPPPPAPPSVPGQPPPPPSPEVYTVIVPPSATYSTATIAIAPNVPVTTASAATAIAKRARLNFQQSRRWTNFQIVVYNDGNSPGASAFKQIMNDRRGKPFGPQDYSQLASQNVWSGAVIYYVSDGSSDHAYTPSGNANWSPSR